MAARLLNLATAAGIALITHTAVAAAAQPTVTLRPAAGPAGQQVRLTATGFGSRQGIRVRVGDRVVARPHAGADGTLSASVRVGRRAHGDVLITTQSTGRRVTNHFLIGTADRDVAEVATAAGIRVRVSPGAAIAGTPLRLRASGLARRARFQILVSGTDPVLLRSGADGRLDGAVRLPATAAGAAVELRGQGVRVRLPVTITAGDAAQPAFPIRAAFYYPWFPEAWRQRGLSPFTHFAPGPGLYSSDDPAILRRQVADMRYGRIDAGIVSWFGRDSAGDRRLALLLQAGRDTPFRWAVYYEPEGRRDPPVAELRADLAHIAARFASDPAYLRVGRRFVVFVYGDANDGADMVRRWHEANTVGAYAVLKVFPGYRSADGAPQSWHQYSPAVPTSSQEGFSFSVSPGFWLATDDQPRLERSVARFREDVQQMTASGAPWQLITTFNEWGEGTAVEPADQWSSPSGHGAFLDVLHAG